MNIVKCFYFFENEYGDDKWAVSICNNSSNFCLSVVLYKFLVPIMLLWINTCLLKNGIIENAQSNEKLYLI